MQRTTPPRGATQFIATVTLSTHGVDAPSTLRLRRDSLADALHALGEVAQRWGTTGATRVARANVVEVDPVDRPVRAYDLDGRPLPAAA